VEVDSIKEMTLTMLLKNGKKRGDHCIVPAQTILKEMAAKIE
jgi:hypothetical protein